MKKKQIINLTKKHVKDALYSEGSGHDWWHTLRVLKTAQHIQKQEGGDIFTIELAALLHDIADWKFHNNDETLSAKTAKKWLEKLNVEKNIIEHIYQIILHISYKGYGVKNKINTIEGKIVQDSDRLDALGAIGIARTFAYGGFKNRSLYDPKIKPAKHKTFKTYKNSKSHTINHFYEKLLLLSSLMNTITGKNIALKRQKFMEKYLEEFFIEWQGKDY